MRMYEYFNSRYNQMKKDLRNIDIPMAIKVRLLQEIQDTVMMLKKIFQDNKQIDSRSLISSICKAIQTSSPIRIVFLIKFLRDIPGHTVDVDYIMKNFKYLQTLGTTECSKLEEKKILKDKNSNYETPKDDIETPEA